MVSVARRFAPILLLASCVSWSVASHATEPSNWATAANAPKLGDPARGYRWLTEKAYLPADFDQEVFDNLWRAWPEPIRTVAEVANAEERRRLTFRHYGLTERPNDPLRRPLQYVVDVNGRWSMNCFACHGGSVDGQVIPGLPNSNYALETLTADVRATKLNLGHPLTHMDVGSLFMPLGKTRGTTNAVMFGVALLAYRDDDLNILGTRLPPAMDHHDMDAPPWWHFSKKNQLYIDGFAPKSHRALMQFMLVEQNGPEKFREWETDFKDVYAFLTSLDAPEYPRAVDLDLAANGQHVFDAKCAECHGGRDTYPERLVPWEEVRTDRVRLDSLSPKHRERYRTSWFNTSPVSRVVTDPGGYVAPPLNGVWASAPYLHNGSVPTLWHMMHPQQRPTVWRRQSGTYDHDRLGLDVVELDQLPRDITSNAERREFFDTTRHGKSQRGHDFPDSLTEVQKRAVLEYLKTL